MPVFVKRALKLASTDYVKAALLFTRDFLNQDKEVVRILLHEDRKQ